MKIRIRKVWNWNGVEALHNEIHNLTKHTQSGQGTQAPLNYQLKWEMSSYYN